MLSGHSSSSLYYIYVSCYSISRCLVMLPGDSSPRRSFKGDSLAQKPRQRATEWFFLHPHGYPGDSTRQADIGQEVDVGSEDNSGTRCWVFARNTAGRAQNTPSPGLQGGCFVPLPKQQIGLQADFGGFHVGVHTFTSAGIAQTG